MNKKIKIYVILHKIIIKYLNLTEGNYTYSEKRISYTEFVNAYMLNQQKNSNLITFAKTCVFVFLKFKPNLPGNLFKAVIVVTGVCG